MPALAAPSPPSCAAAPLSVRAGGSLMGTCPSWVASARGAWLWDAHGQRRLDMAGAGGTLVLGHADPDVERAAAGAGETAHALAETRLLERQPWMDRAMFAADPETAREAALTACRRATSRLTVLTIATLEGAAGATERLAAGEVAAVVIDPSTLPHGLPAALRALTAAVGAMLVFDETATDLRRHAGGMQAMLGVRADLCLFGSGLANGRRLGAVVGRAAPMAELIPPPKASPETLAAAAETLNKVEVEGAPLAIAVRGAEIQAELCDRLDRAGAGGFARMDGDPSACRLVLDHPEANGLERRFSAQLAAHGVHGGAVSLPSFAHGDEEVDALLDAWTAALPSLVRAAARPVRA